MAMRCFGRARFAGTARALVLRSFALIDLRAVDLAAALRAGDFFWAAVLAAARAVGFFVGFFLAIDVLPYRLSEKVSTNGTSWGGSAKRNPPPRGKNGGLRLRRTHPTNSDLSRRSSKSEGGSMQPEHAVDGAQFSRLDQFGVR